VPYSLDQSEALSTTSYPSYEMRLNKNVFNLDFKTLGDGSSWEHIPNCSSGTAESFFHKFSVCWGNSQ